MFCIIFTNGTKGILSAELTDSETNSVRVYPGKEPGFFSDGQSIAMKDEGLFDAVALFGEREHAERIARTMCRRGQAYSVLIASAERKRSGRAVIMPTSARISAVG